MTDHSGLHVMRADGVVTLRLDRPEVRNALGVATFDALREAIVEIGRNPEDRVVVIEGANGIFCSGGEVPRPVPGAPVNPSPISTGLRVMQQVVGEAMLALHRCPKPVIAAVDGAAVGAGAALVLACDLAFASERARFALPFVTLGLGLDAGISWTLPRTVGMNKAKELAFLGDSVSASEAADLGLVNQVLPADELSTKVADVCARLSANSPTALTMIKQALHRSHHSTFADALEAEALAQVLSGRSGERRPS